MTPQPSYNFTTLAIVLLLCGCGPTISIPADGESHGSDDGTSSAQTDGFGGSDSGGADETSVGPDTTGLDTGPDSGSGDDGTVAGCGNGRLEADEVCDDGNQVDADGCNADCLPSGTVQWSATVDGGLGYDVGIALVVDVEDRPALVTDLDAGDNVRSVGLDAYTSGGQPRWSIATDAERKFDGIAATADGALTWVHHAVDAQQDYVVEHIGDDGIVWTIDGFVSDVVYVDGLAPLANGRTLIGGSYGSDVLRYVEIDDDGTVHPGGFLTGVATLRGFAPTPDGFVALSQPPTSAFFLAGAHPAFRAFVDDLPGAGVGPFSVGGGEYGYVADGQVVTFDIGGGSGSVVLREGVSWVDGTSTPAGHLVVVGLERGGVVDKYTVDGDLLWSRSVREAAALLDVAADSDGAVYVAGVAGDGGTDGDGVLVKLSP